MIINPWFFYILQLCNDLREAIMIAGIISVGACVLLFIENSVEGSSHPTKPFFIAGIILMFAGKIIPTRDTLLLMKASEFITYDNAQLTVDALKSAIDYAASLM